MGMFDDVICEAALPDGASEQRGFQTKSFSWPSLNKYKIAADGSLWLLRYDLIPTDADTTAPFKRENERWQLVEGFRGEIIFYRSIEGQRHEYSALFDAGRLLSIVTTPNHEAGRR